MKTTSWILIAAVIAVLTLFARNKTVDEVSPVPADSSPSPAAASAPTESTKTTTVQFTLKTAADGGKLLFQGVGGEIDGMVNPDIHVPQGANVEITLINADGMPHDIFLPDFNAQSSYVARIGDQTKLVFQVDSVQPGTYAYYCDVPGHRQAGQEGKLIVVQP